MLEKIDAADEAKGIGWPCYFEHGEVSAIWGPFTLCGCGRGDHFLRIHLGLSLKKLGVYLKEDDELQGQDEETFLNGDWEEGEIHSWSIGGVEGNWA